MLLRSSILPKWFSKKYRERRHFTMPEIEKGSAPLFWIHAVSVGEVKAVAQLAKKLQEHYGATLVVSTVTGTGYQEAKRTLPVPIIISFYLWISVGI